MNLLHGWGVNKTVIETGVDWRRLELHYDLSQTPSISQSVPVKLSNLRRVENQGAARGMRGRKWIPIE